MRRRRGKYFLASMISDLCLFSLDFTFYLSQGHRHCAGRLQSSIRTPQATYLSFIHKLKLETDTQKTGKLNYVLDTLRMTHDSKEAVSNIRMRTIHVAL